MLCGRAQKLSSPTSFFVFLHFWFETHQIPSFLPPCVLVIYMYVCMRMRVRATTCYSEFFSVFTLPVASVFQFSNSQVSHPEFVFAFANTHKFFSLFHFQIGAALRSKSAAVPKCYSPTCPHQNARRAKFAARSLRQCPCPLLFQCTWPLQTIL